MAQTVCGIDGNGSLLTNVSLTGRAALFGIRPVRGPEHALSKRFADMARDPLTS
jgi:hypothetical protein